MKQIVNIGYFEGQQLIDRGLSQESILIWLILKSLYNANNEKAYVTAEMLYNIMYDKELSNNRNKKQSIIDSIRELDANEIIKILDINKDYIVLDLSNLALKEEIEVTQFDENYFFENNTKGYSIFDTNISDVPVDDLKEGYVTKTIKNYYFQMDWENIKKAFNEGNNRPEIIMYMLKFLSLKGENNMFYFIASRTDLVNRLGMNIKTIDKYNEILSDAHIIYIKKFDYKYIDTGNQLKSLYGLYREQDIKAIDESADKFVKQQLEAKKIKYSPLKASEPKVNDVKPKVNDVKPKQKGLAFSLRPSKLIKDDESTEKIRHIDKHLETRQSKLIVENEHTEEHKKYFGSRPSKLIMYDFEEDNEPNPFDDDPKPIREIEPIIEEPNPFDDEPKNIIHIEPKHQPTWEEQEANC